MKCVLDLSSSEKTIVCGGYCLCQCYVNYVDGHKHVVTLDVVDHPSICIDQCNDLKDHPTCRIAISSVYSNCS